jgi:hypothetical protein
MGTAMWSVITNRSPAGIQIFVATLCVILAVATSIIIERHPAAFLWNFDGHKYRLHRD